jgi:DNA repair photolyase
MSEAKRDHDGLRGRGAASNPANRFELITIDGVPELLDEDGPGLETRFYRDHARSIIAYNESPDVGFNASINPYRGCEHGCVYCLSGDTPILMADGTTRMLAELHIGDEVYGTEREGWYRRYVRTRILDHWQTFAAAYRIQLRDGTTLVASGDHRFWTERGWKFIADSPHRPRPHLVVNDRLFGMSKSTPQPIDGRAIGSPVDLAVVSVDALDHALPLYDITTGTGNFIANGVVSHNCYARPTHEYLGFSAGLDFETRIMVKEDAPELLRKELASPKWEPQMIALAGATDAYQPIERRLQLSRRCLEVLAEFRNPVGVVTKNHLVSRDRDLLAELAGFNASLVYLSITTLDAELSRRLEPRASHPDARLQSIRELSGAGVPTGVLVAPIIPGLNDHETPAILAAAAEAGARYALFVLLRLPHGLGPLFEEWLDRHYPDAKHKVLGRLRDMRGGKLYDSRFGRRMRGQGVLAEQVRALFKLGCRKAGISTDPPLLSSSAFRRSRWTQGLLFE